MASMIAGVGIENNVSRRFTLGAQVMEMFMCIIY